MSSAMDDEFDTVAAWTADAAIELGPDYYLPAGCRGSGGPQALNWLLSGLAVTRATRMLDCGAGVGGPAGFAADRCGARPVLAEPEAGACRAAVALFGLPTVRATAQRLPFPDASFDVAWSLAVLCTTDDQVGLLTELRRVVRARGRIGMLVYVRTVDDLPDKPDGNNFPTDDELADQLRRAGLTVDETRDSRDFADADADPDWTRRADAVEALVARKHRNDEAWRIADDQASSFGSVLDDGRVQGRLLVLSASETGV